MLKPIWTRRLLWLSLMLLWGCQAGEGEFLAATGPDCTSDEECALGAVCEELRCVLKGGNVDLMDADSDT